MSLPLSDLHSVDTHPKVWGDYVDWQFGASAIVKEQTLEETQKIADSDVPCY